MMFKTVLVVFTLIFTIGSVIGQKGGYKSDRFIQQQQYPYYPSKTSPYISQSPMMGQYRYPYSPPLSPIEQRRAQLLMRNMGGLIPFPLQKVTHIMDNPLYSQSIRKF